MNRMDGGYALRLPVDAIAEFRILTQSAPPEYGGTGGATTSVVTRARRQPAPRQRSTSSCATTRSTRATSSRARSSRSTSTSSAARSAARSASNRAFFFGYYEGFRNKQGVTTTATVPTRAGAAGRLLRHAAAAAQPRRRRRAVPGQPASAGRHQSGRAQRRRTSIRSATSRRRSTARRWSARTGSTRSATRVDFNASSQRPDVRPLLLLGRSQHQPDLGARHRRARLSDARRPRDALGAGVGHAHLSPTLTNSLRVTFLRHKFLFDQRLNQTPPSALGFGYESSNEAGQGPPFFNVSGYTPIGGAITGPRNSTQTTFEVQDAVAWTRGAHLVKVGGEFRRHRHRHVPGDRAERLLRLRRHLPDQQRHRQPAARRAGDLLPGPRRLQPRRSASGTSAPTCRTSGGSAPR